ITPVNPGDVAAATVATEQYHAVRERAFEHGQHVVAIEPEFPAADLRGREFALAAMLRGLERTGATADSHSLAAREIMAVADEFGGGARGVTVVEQPAEVLRGGV